MDLSETAWCQSITSNAARLRALGTLVTQSGRIDLDSTSLCLHSSIGPVGLDKTVVNQDYALAWVADSDQATGPRWAVAVADGLTSSFWSDRAAALACHAAVLAIVTKGRPGPGTPASLKERGLAALSEAATALVSYARVLRKDPDASRPINEVPFVSTWKYMLDRGTLLRTTLSLAWNEEDTVCLAVVGDGGALWNESGIQTVLAECDLSTEQVNALGPLVSMPVEPDLLHEQPVTGPYQLALFCDGIGRGLGLEVPTLWDRLPADDENPARAFIERVCIEEPEKYADNLTLILIRGLSRRA